MDFSYFRRWSAIFFNKLVVCPVSLPGPGFYHWGLLWCFWGITHLLWIWLRSGPGHCVVETRLPLHCLIWKSGFVALCEGQCRGEPLHESTTERYALDLDMISIGRTGESLVFPILGLQMKYDGFNLFLYEMDVHVDLSALDRVQWERELLWGFSETF